SRPQRKPKGLRGRALSHTAGTRRGYIFDSFIVFPMTRVIRLLLLLATAALVSSCSKSPVTSSAPSAVVDGGAVRLQWTAVPEQTVNGSRVDYGTASRSYLQPVGQGLVSTATSYPVTGLAGPRRYFFAVTATNTLGKESGLSDEVVLDLP